MAIKLAIKTGGEFSASSRRTFVANLVIVPRSPLIGTVFAQILSQSCRGRGEVVLRTPLPPELAVAQEKFKGRSRDHKESHKNRQKKSPEQ